MINAEEAKKRSNERLDAQKLKLTELYDAIDMASTAGQFGILWNALNVTQVEALKAKNFKVDKQNIHTYMVSWL